MLWLILFLPSPKFVPSDEVVEGWDEKYTTEMTRAAISREYLVETEYYDFSNPSIQDIIEDIKSKSDNVEQATANALDYVFRNVPYNALESDEVCFQAKGSTVIKTRTGQCDTQTIAVITLLRGMGIASRSVGGCIYKKTVCEVRQSLMSMFAQVGFPYEPPPEPKFVPIVLDDKEEIGRAGGLHAWGEVWLPEDGWVVFESTTGELVRSSCYAYEVELYPANDDKKHLCVSTNRQFANYCAAK
jgi:transglutaminase-like putative cysteine protease